MDRIKLSQAVIVEGKYDQIRLASVLDAVIIRTEGFRIFKDDEMAELIRRYASTTGIIILTDSDSAGFRIRSHIKGICPGGKIENVYIPDIYGKEPRKAEPSKEGKLGVEGIGCEELARLFRRFENIDALPEQEPMTIQELYELGLFGGPGSSELRRKVARRLSLPERLSPKNLLEAVNSLCGRSEFIRQVNAVKEAADT